MSVEEFRDLMKAFGNALTPKQVRFMSLHRQWNTKLCFGRALLSQDASFVETGHPVSWVFQVQTLERFWTLLIFLIQFVGKCQIICFT